MFGANRVAPRESWNPETQRYKVQEVFHTIQGEGPFSGLPAVFVRFVGCNLRCFFCDTDFTSSTWEPSLDELAEKILEVRGAAPCDLIVITGGEPLLQEVGFLVDRMAKEHGFKTQIETAGTVWPRSMSFPDIDSLIALGTVSIVCSPKTPQICADVEARCLDYKYLIEGPGAIDELDGLPVMSTQAAGKKAHLYRPPHSAGARIWVQPMEHYTITRGISPEHGESIILDHKRDSVASASATETAATVAMRHGYRLSLQVHKLVGLP